MVCLFCVMLTLDFPVFMAESEKHAMKRILVTGGSGLVGCAIRNIATVEEFREDEEWIFVTSDDADLTYYFFICDCFLHVLLPERDHVTFGSLLSQIRLSVVCL